MENKKRGKIIGAIKFNSEKFVTQKLNTNKRKKMKRKKEREREHIFQNMCHEITGAN